MSYAHLEVLLFLMFGPLLLAGTIHFVYALTHSKKSPELLSPGLIALKMMDEELAEDERQ